MFSPYYARALKRLGAAVDPQDHVCINVAFYGAGGHRWAMTERSSRHLARSATHFQVGPSDLSWNGRWFELNFDERECPWPVRLKGRIRVHPSAFTAFRADLDEQGLHRWGPIAPCARVEVDLGPGASTWSGQGYFDSNDGDEPIHRPFERWDWSRSASPSGHTAVLYDVQCKSGAERLVLQRFSPQGDSESFEAPPRQRLPTTAWGIARSTRSDLGSSPRVLKVFENTPFYVRDLLSSTVLGETGHSVHESLDARRLAAWPVQMMLPFRMPRRR